MKLTRSQRFVLFLAIVLATAFALAPVIAAAANPNSVISPNIIPGC
ncbi:MAG: hypothetical protein HYR64_01605 [Fimbriimonas ginsengisoli]|uniref:Uncharacterized protein n=1 Tax=Fimbriimonas ginsengisoli TaxID=1005039 RepID=A0A931PTT1_FIMGI|nr:hypothetical protein [Fimbriimonas ginsengisoli]